MEYIDMSINEYMYMINNEINCRIMYEEAGIVYESEGGSRLEKIKKFFVDLWEKIKKFFKEKCEKIKSLFKRDASKFKNVKLKKGEYILTNCIKYNMSVADPELYYAKLTNSSTYNEYYKTFEKVKSYNEEIDGILTTADKVYLQLNKDLGFKGCNNLKDAAKHLMHISIDTRISKVTPEILETEKKYAMNDFEKNVNKTLDIIAKMDKLVEGITDKFGNIDNPDDKVLISNVARLMLFFNLFLGYAKGILDTCININKARYNQFVYLSKAATTGTGTATSDLAGHITSGPGGDEIEKLRAKHKEKNQNESTDLFLDIFDNL